MRVGTLPLLVFAAISAPSLAKPAPALPHTLVGIWASSKGGCSPGNARRIDIAPGTLVSRSGRMRITGVTPVGPNSWGIDADVAASGQAVRHSFDLNLSSDDRTLTRVEAPVPDIVYHRCPRATR